MRYSKITGKFAVPALCAVLAGAGLAGTCAPFTAYAASYEKVDGVYRMPDGTAIEGVVARGIDVSRWQTTIDWNAVAADDVQFVMLGTRSRGAVDPYFHANVKGASDAGIRVGAYIYSMATTPQMAVEEADFVLELVKDYPVSFPIAFDAEDASTLGTLPPAQVSQVINAFCKRIEEAGYYPIVYANDTWLSSKIDMSSMPYDVWVARYGKKHAFADPIMWQATSSGSINGINGNVDIDFLYRDLSPKLPGSLWRTIGGKTYYYQNYAMQKDTWINDGSGWFYMNGEGLASTGWLTKAGLSYYLEQGSGRMVTGWKEVDGSAYYFNGSGAMMTGWVNDNGSYYYMGSDGKMHTGWLELAGKHYYLETGAGFQANPSGQQPQTGTGGNVSVGNGPGGSSNGSSSGGPGGSSGGSSDGSASGGPGGSSGGSSFGEPGGSSGGNASGGPGGSSGDSVSGGPGGSSGDSVSGTSGGSGSGTLAGSSRDSWGNAGKMAVGWKQLDGSWYFFDRSEGSMVTGWLDDNGARYHLGSDGVMSTGWQTDGKASYYLTESGAASVGWKSIDNIWYFFGNDGAMNTGWIHPDDNWYYLDTNGRMKNGWEEMDGKWYYLSPSSGRMIIGWREVDGSWYYFDSSGAMMTGLQDIEGKLYYLNPENGKMAVSTVLELNGVNYSADASGVCSVIEENNGAEASQGESGQTGNGPSTDISSES